MAGGPRRESGRSLRPPAGILRSGASPSPNAVNSLDVLDVEAAILSGRIEQTLTRDPRGTRYVVVGTACDEFTPAAVVVRFVERDQLLVITVYEIK